ncbi:hypothetical protein [Erwinia amylovora]|nr:hypothetical protein [Erwinia amylovora]
MGFARCSVCAGVYGRWLPSVVEWFLQLWSYARRFWRELPLTRSG